MFFGIIIHFYFPAGKWMDWAFPQSLVCGKETGLYFIINKMLSVESKLLI